MLKGSLEKWRIRRKWRICIQQFKNGKSDEKSPKSWLKFKLDSKEMSFSCVLGERSSPSIRKLPSASVTGEYVELLGCREISMFPLLFIKYGLLPAFLNECEIVWDFELELP